MTTTKAPIPISISFSPAGVLYCSYHFGAASILNDLVEVDDATIVGVSAGALTAAAMKLKISIETAQEWILRVRRLKEADKNISLVDELEKFLPQELKKHFGGAKDADYEDYDKDMFQKSVQGLRIGMSRCRTVLGAAFGLACNNSDRKAFCYVDSFRDVDDLVASLLTSCFLPGKTGPFRGKKDRKFGAIRRAHERLKEMENLGFVKTYGSNKPVIQRELMRKRRMMLPWHRGHESYYVDGSYTNCFPREDSDTVIVTPVYMVHNENPTISPECACGGKRVFGIVPKKFQAFDAKISLCKCNAEVVKNMNSRVIQNEDIDKIFNMGRKDTLNYFGITL